MAHNVRPLSEFGENTSRVFSATANEFKEKKRSTTKKPADLLSGG